MINRRYAIVQKLGRGGSGEVYLVEDTLDESRLVAIKVLHPPGEAGSIDEVQFRREVSLVLGLNHPYLVQILDSGTIYHAEDEQLEGRSFYTMEFIKGTHALEWAQSLPDDSRRATALRALLRQCAAALQYLHREGIIHHDLKPENLMVALGEDDPFTPSLKMMDFGLSHDIGGGDHVPLRGTLHYMAPELLRGEGGDCRVDLFSLGATFYHLLEGKPAFEAPTPDLLVKSVLTHAPQFGSSPIPGMAELQAVIVRLLEKDPSDRFQTAKDVLQALSDHPQEAVPDVSPVSIRPRFVGRVQELEMVSETLRTIAEGNSQNVPFGYCFTGPHGCGKTALLDRMKRVAKGTGLLTYDVPPGIREVPWSGALPFLIRLEAELLCRSPESERISRTYSPALRRLREGTGGTLADTGNAGTTELLARMALEMSAITPVVLMIDDLAHRDEQTQGFVVTVMRDASPARVLLLAASEQEVDWLSARVQKMHIAELTENDVVAMCASVWGTAPLINSLAAKLNKLYGGMPYLIIEAIGTLVKTVTPELLHDEATAQQTLDEITELLPKSIDEFLLSWFQRYSDDCRLSLEYLACFGNPVRVETLMALIPLPRPRIRSALNALLADGVVSAGDLGSRVTLRQDRFRTAIHQHLGTESAKLHAKVITALEETVNQPTLLDLQELGQQCVAGGYPDVASSYFTEAARTAFKLRAYQKAATLYADAIANAPENVDPSHLVQLRTALADALRRAGQYQEAASIATDLLQLEGTDRTTRMPLYRTLGLSLHRLGRYEDAKTALLSALDDATDLTTRLSVQQELAAVEIALGDFAEAEAFCKEQLVQIERSGNRLILASIHTNLGIAAFYQNKFEDALANFLVALNSYVQADQPAMLADTLNNMGNALSAKGDYAAAVLYWTRAMESSQEYGTSYQLAQIQNNLGIAHYNLRLYDRAREHYATACGIFRRINSRSGEAFTLTNLGEVLFAECEYETALNRWTEALVLYREMDDAIGVAETNLQIAEVSMILGQYPAARNTLSDADRGIREKNLTAFEERLASLRGLLLLKEGNAASARDLFVQTRKQFQEAGNVEKECIALLHIAKCDMALENFDTALTQLLDLVRDGQENVSPLVSAEIQFLLGVVARTGPGRAPAHPLIYFKKGWQHIREESICELTWKLTFALGREYHERGQPERAREYLTRTKVIIDFLASHFSDDRLRSEYLRLDHKEKILSSIHALL